MFSNGLIGQYPWLLWITVVWVVVLIIVKLLRVSRPVVMRFLSLLMLLGFIGVAADGMYMIFFGYTKIFGISIIKIHITSGYIFSLAALSHILIHWRELWLYTKKLVSRQHRAQSMKQTDGPTPPSV